MANPVVRGFFESQTKTCVTGTALFGQHHAVVYPAIPTLILSVYNILRVTLDV